MPLTVIDLDTGQEVVSIDESTPFAVGQAWTAVTTDRMGRNDKRRDEELVGTIIVRMPLPAAQRVAGKRVVVFIIEE